MCGFIPDKSCGEVSVSRTALFAEVRIRIGNKRHMLCAPLVAGATERAEQAAHAIRRTGCAAVPEYRILRDEMKFRTSTDKVCRCDILLYPLPEGEPLGTAVTHIPTDILRNALDALRTEFLRTGFLHGNLKAGNLIFTDDGRLCPIRCHYARMGASADEIEAETDTVRQYISSFPFIPTEHNDISAPYATVYDGHGDEYAPLHDMMRRIRRNGLYGFADADGNTIIEPQFEYADHFRENRSVVETETGMGVIDRDGRYVIPARYDIVEFDPEREDYAVRLGTKWARFDYAGRRTEEFHENTEDTTIKTH